MLPELQARDVDGYRLGYREAGQGEALVLFHGLVLWGEEDQRSPLQVAVQLRDAFRRPSWP